MIYELRIYHAAPGRLRDIMNRFDKVTLGIWKRFGIRQAGFWTVAIGPSNHALYYMLQWESLAERAEKWNAFMADPEWQEKRAESERNGPLLTKIENMILEPTSFSSVK